MSDRNQARRTTAEVVFGGTDITSSIRPYLLSLTYTDNEEDEADDLQIKLQDRDSIWLEKWLSDAIQAAASSAPAEGAGEAEAKTYKVTPSIGLNVRTGPGTSYGKLGALPYGTEVSVTGISNGWATIQYSGKTAYVSAQYIQEVGGGQAEESSEASATTAVIIRLTRSHDTHEQKGSRSMKEKITSLVLVLVVAMSMTVGASAASYIPEQTAFVYLPLPAKSAYMRSFRQPALFRSSLLASRRVLLSAP